MATIDKKYEDNYVKHSVSNCEVRWAKLVDYDEFKGQNKWKLDVILDDDTAEELKEIGFNVREKDGIKFFTPSKKAFDSNGKPNKPPRVVDANVVPFDGEIGNGSRCNINFEGKKWDVSTNITAYLLEVQVIDLVEYNGGSGFSPVEPGQGVI